ncbi:MAG: hypothetical protein K9J16_14740 [Melioribacteraceae bacterium]|nr:hypothetical protein [Melioribacteraceae bacterium]MCF8355819.1 hypothetical protein [Melioribacteraceae bacterium]MCF8395288.1 hypothetical protein [Melioribacteraceae bacterium]MCF8420725.1 hypothetical protein [Melioribacteraceae bacterium]
MLFNFIMVHHITVSFKEIELAVILFTLSYFTGISIGYFFSDKIDVKLIRILTPVYFIIQLLLVASVQTASYFIFDYFRDLTGSADFGTLTAFVVVFFFLLLGGTSMYSVFLPNIIESENKDLKHFYSVEIAGSILGLALLIPLTQFNHSYMLAFYFLLFIIIAYFTGSSYKSIIVFSVITIFFTYNFDLLDKSTSTIFYKNRYGKDYVSEIVFIKYTPYHKIEIAELRDGEFMLILNGKRQFAEGSHYTYSYFVAEYSARLIGNPTVCLMGCGSMSTVGRIGGFSKHIDIVDLDEAVFDVSKKYFAKYNKLNSLNNWSFVADDAKHYIANTNQKYDLILHDIPPARSRQTALTYTREFFQLVKSRLTANGLFSISSLTPLKSKSKYGLRMLATLCSVFDNYFALLVNNDVYFYGGLNSLKFPGAPNLTRLIDHPKKNEIVVLSKRELDQLVEGVDVITINNLGNLIFE